MGPRTGTVVPGTQIGTGMVTRGVENVMTHVGGKTGTGIAGMRGVTVGVGGVMTGKVTGTGVGGVAGKRQTAADTVAVAHPRRGVVGARQARVRRESRRVGMSGVARGAARRLRGAAGRQLAGPAAGAAQAAVAPVVAAAVVGVPGRVVAVAHLAAVGHPGARTPHRLFITLIALCGLWSGLAKRPACYVLETDRLPGH